MENDKKTLQQIIKSRKSTRNFSAEIPSIEHINKIIESAVYAPYGGATGIPLDELRRVFIFRQGTDSIETLKGIFLSQMRKNAKKLNLLLRILPFLKPKMQTFANKVNGFSKNGIPALNNGAYFIVLAEKKGFPPIEKQSMAHAMENMWLTATDLGLGFQLVTATSTLSDNKDFLKLLNLKKGVYALDACVIGYPKSNNTRAKEFDITNFTTWME